MPVETLEVERDEQILLIEEAMRMKTGFNAKQVEGIMHINSPLNMLACAGSGKTTSNIGRILYFQLKHGIKPKTIIAICFNREAMEEMQTRYQKAARRLEIDDKFEVTFVTYHAMFRRIIEKYMPTLNLDGDGNVTNNMFYAAAREAFGRGASDEEIENVKTMRQYGINNLMLNIEHLVTSPRFATTKLDPVKFSRALDKYRTLKKEANILDFDDLQFKMYQLVSTNEQARLEIRDMYDHYIVDEYQDVCKIQNEILKLIMPDYNQFTTIGDDDQTIYDFRGSKVDFIVDMGLHFKGTKRIIMNTNYRCPENILKPLERMVSKNIKRVDKQMIAAKDGGILRFIPCGSNGAASWAIAEEISNRYNADDGDHLLGNVAVLYRNLKQQTMLVDMMMAKHLPIRVLRRSSLLYDHMIVRDIIAITQLALNPNDSALFAKVGLKITAYASNGKTMFIKKDEINNVAHRMRMGTTWMEIMANSPYDSVHTAIVEMNLIRDLINANRPFNKIIDVIERLYGTFLTFVMDSSQSNSVDHFETLNYLKYVSQNKSFKKFKDWIDRTKQYLNQFENESNAVTITTMHSVKGLEYPRVYILYASEDTCPNAGIANDLLEKFNEQESRDYIEQENRLMYVAGTRAKEELVITYDVETPSRFIEWMEVDLPNICEPIITLPDKLIVTEQNVVAPDSPEIQDDDNEGPDDLYLYEDDEDDN